MVVAKSPVKPRMLMFWARPLTRWAATPVRRVRESAMLTSGSLPMSSDMMTSTIAWLFSLAWAAAARLPLKPLLTLKVSSTTTSSFLAGSSVATTGTVFSSFFSSVAVAAAWP